MREYKARATAATTAIDLRAKTQLLRFSPTEARLRVISPPADSYNLLSINLVGQLDLHRFLG